ncbi:dioxygenase [Microbacterium aureliae]
MAKAGRDRASRAVRDRARLYQARRAFHETRARRRTRDNIVAGVAGGLLILGIAAAQTVYFTAGPGAPEPTPTSTPIRTIAPTPGETPAETPAPDPSASPAPTP